MTAPPSRSQLTRERIVTAARRVFAAEGYERTTIRTVAGEAHINPSMVIRYFGSKEGLFASAVRFDLLLPDLAAIPPAERGRVLAAHFFQRWESAAEGGELPALLRASVSHAAARATMVDIFERQLVAAVTRLYGPRQAACAAPLIAAQMLGLALTRYVLALPAMVEMPSAEVLEAVGSTLQSYLDMDVGPDK